MPSHCSPGNVTQRYRRMAIRLKLRRWWLGGQ